MSFKDRVIKQIKLIPFGKVTTYGTIAALAGSPRAAISVGQILHNTVVEQDLPWHRVINSKGWISTTCLEHPPQLQAQLLRSEGVEVIEKVGNWQIDLAKYSWPI